jgi:hypothetical protein
MSSFFFRLMLNRSETQYVLNKAGNKNKMMTRVIPLIIAFLLLGAHFLRSAHIILAGASLLIPLLLLIKKRWSLLLVKWLTYSGAIVWMQTTFSLVQQRRMAGLPWIRMMLILSGVTILTLYAGYLLNSDIVKRRYQ